MIILAGRWIDPIFECNLKFHLLLSLDSLFQFRLNNHWSIDHKQTSGWFILCNCVNCHGFECDRFDVSLDVLLDLDRLFVRKIRTTSQNVIMKCSFLAIGLFFSISLRNMNWKDERNTGDGSDQRKEVFEGNSN